MLQHKSSKPEASIASASTSDDKNVVVVAGPDAIGHSAHAADRCAECDAAGRLTDDGNLFGSIDVFLIAGKCSCKGTGRSRSLDLLGRDKRADTTEKKREILTRILVAWERDRELRLGQLIINATNQEALAGAVGLFSIEDEPLVDMIERFVSSRRAPIQGDRKLPLGTPWRERGSVMWAEHEEAYVVYAKKYGDGQSSERIAARGGFGYEEISNLLGHAPVTWLADETLAARERKSGG